MVAKFLCWADVKLGKLILTLTAVPARGERVPKLRRLSGAGRKFERIYAPLFHICAAHFPGSIVVSSLFVSLGGVMTCTPFQRDLKSPPFLPPQISSWNRTRLPSLGKINEKRSTRSLKPARVVCRDTVETSSYKLELYWIEGKLASFPTRPRMEDGISKHLCGVTRHVLATSFHQRSKFASNTMDLVSWREIPVKILFIFFDVTLNDRTVCSLSKNKKGMLISYASLHREEDYVSNIFTSDQISSLACFNPMNVLLILLINSCRESTYERYAFTYIFVASFFMKHLQIVWFYMNYVSILFNTNKCEEDYYRFGIATYCFRLF